MSRQEGDRQAWGPPQPQPPRYSFAARFIGAGLIAFAVIAWLASYIGVPWWVVAIVVTLATAYGGHVYLDKKGVRR